MKRVVLVFSALALFCINIFTLDVAVDELKTNAKVNFINYTGPHRFMDSLFTIRGIGQKLANVNEDNQIFNYLMKYSIIRATDDSTSDKYSSDIFSIDKEARVDHIRNVQNIIGSYLEKKYGLQQGRCFNVSSICNILQCSLQGKYRLFCREI